ncbi:hypothetical protein Tco_0689144 [Tanacetum coccineum]
MKASGHSSRKPEGVATQVGMCDGRCRLIRLPGAGLYALRGGQHQLLTAWGWAWRGLGGSSNPRVGLVRVGGGQRMDWDVRCGNGVDGGGHGVGDGAAALKHVREGGGGRGDDRCQAMKGVRDDKEGVWQAKGGAGTWRAANQERRDYEQEDMGHVRSARLTKVGKRFNGAQGVKAAGVIMDTGAKIGRCGVYEKRVGGLDGVLRGVRVGESGRLEERRGLGALEVCGYGERWPGTVDRGHIATMSRGIVEMNKYECIKVSRRGILFSGDYTPEWGKEHGRTGEREEMILGYLAPSMRHAEEMTLGVDDGVSREGRLCLCARTESDHCINDVDAAFRHGGGAKRTQPKVPSTTSIQLNPSVGGGATASKTSKQPIKDTSYFVHSIAFK